MTDEHSQVEIDILQTEKKKQYTTKTTVLEDMCCAVFTSAWHSVCVCIGTNFSLPSKPYSYHKHVT